MKRIFRWLACLSLAGAAGCGIFWDDPYVQVTTTPLNWIEVHYYNANREPIRREAVRVTGAGFVEVRAGTSRRVSDSFAKSVTDETWDDCNTQQYQVDPEHVRELFQDLVNAGLFDKDKMLRLFERVRLTRKPVRSVMVIGGGELGETVAERLIKKHISEIRE